MKKIILLFACLILFGCDRDGNMADIYHDGKLVATTQCNDRVWVRQTLDTLEVYVQHDTQGWVGFVWDNIEQYTYVNDSKYNVTVKPCFYKD